MAKAKAPRSGGKAPAKDTNKGDDTPTKRGTVPRHQDRRQAEESALRAQLDGDRRNVQAGDRQRRRRLGSRNRSCVNFCTH